MPWKGVRNPRMFLGRGKIQGVSLGGGKIQGSERMLGGRSFLRLVLGKSERMLGRHSFSGLGSQERCSEGTWLTT